jgi:hypothetical protein
MKQCLIDRCWRPYTANGYCKVHYERVRRHGNPHHSSIMPTINGEPITNEFIKDLQLTLKEAK